MATIRVSDKAAAELLRRQKQPGGKSPQLQIDELLFPAKTEKPAPAPAAAKPVITPAPKFPGFTKRLK